MSTKHFIALDTHCGFCQMAAVNAAGKVIRRERIETTIPKLVEAIESIRKPRVLTFEEGPLAGWLSRGLAEFVDELIVCEPRRNALISKEGDKDDPVDAEKLARLFRGGFLKRVHQAETLDRAVLKQHVGFYHDRIRERVRQGHQLTCQLRRHGIFYGIEELKSCEMRTCAWRELPNRRVLRADLELLWKVYELLLIQEQQIRSELVRLARKERVVRRLEEVPGIGWIRALTFYVYIDTPDRFERKTQLWRYCGLGLERNRSGNGPTRVRLAKAGNRRLKNVLLGGALSAIHQGANPFADKYAYWTKEKGLHPSTARRNVGRSIATTMWSLWRTDRTYDPKRVSIADRSPLMN